MTDILAELDWRGLIADTTDRDALGRDLAAGPMTLYCGFDPTAPSLHIGSLAAILPLRRFQLAGHRPLALVGGATGLIGDPSGKESERVLNDPAVVAEWVERLRAQLGRFLDLSGSYAAQIVNNLDWTAQLTTIDFLRDIGKHFSLNRMLGKDSVSSRLESAGISFTEFSYMLLQSLDYLELFRRHGCRLQTGGSDQWGNITAGADFVRRVEGASVHGLTVPLITKADGTKFGKTESGSVWLDPERTSPYAFYQFWINTDDRDVVGYLKTFTFRAEEEIAAFAAATAERPAAREAQRALAADVTSLVHGPAECARAEAASRALFGGGELREVDATTLAAALAETPHVAVDWPPPPVVELLVAAGLAPSKGAARRTISEGGAYLNNARITEVDAVPGEADLLHGRWLVLRRGRRELAGVERKGSAGAGVMSQ